MPRPSPQLKSLFGLTKARQAIWTGDQMRLLDRDQRSQEAYAVEMQTGLKPEEEVQLTVDSPVTTNNCYPREPRSNVALWVFLSIVVFLLFAAFAAVAAAAFWYFAIRPQAVVITPPIQPPAGSSASQDFIEFYSPTSP